ncbi:hypothetical protein [Candidatus Venteria ishoeyi]|uniref:Lipoprotein n=1 Tax=Candidatus Venteria ishoeyi TaxID=1899563 RepID=A0A1H6FDN5_9GAMM|nr:hypothetical protein [Candidatus Venteria ishoeyi]SEH08200.1 Uncharacterised protein [Candidatus Venteria ishoeyi]
MFKLRQYLLLSGLLLLLNGCIAVNPYNEDLQPLIQVQREGMPLIQWQPQGAQLVRVYQGKYEEDDNTLSGENLIWTLSATTDNSIQSPIRYGEIPPGAQALRPAKKLEPGLFYTVLVRRLDSNARRDKELSNTLNRYEAVYSFRFGGVEMLEP